MLFLLELSSTKEELISLYIALCLLPKVRLLITYLKTLIKLEKFGLGHALV